MIGKVIGGIIGAFAAGPLGFVAGGVIGHFALDVQMKKMTGPSASNLRSFNTSNGLFIEFACQGAAKIAKTKGFVAQNDIQELERIFRQLNFDPEMRRRAISHFRSAKDDTYTLEDIARNFIKHFPQRQARREFLNILLRVALSDHKLDQNEALHLRNVARILHLDPRIIDEIEAATNGTRSKGYRSSSNSAASARSSSRLAEEYAVLGLAPGASADQVKKAYRSKCKDLHPDVLRSKGIGEHAMKVIEDELRRINEAYEKIMKSN